MGRRLFAAFVALTLALASAAGAATPPPSFRALRFEGNRAFSERALYGAMGLSKPGPLRLFRKRGRLQADDLAARLGELRLFYQRRGYFDASVDLVPLNAQTAVVRIREGKPSRVASVALVFPGWGRPTPEGLEPPEELGRIPLQPGRRFDVDAYEESQRVLTGLWKEAGFPFAAATGDAEVDLAAREVRATFAVVPGHRLSFGEVAFEGRGRAEEALLRRGLAFRQGHIYKQSLVDRSVENLTRLGLFDQVAVAVEEAPAESVRVVFRLREGKARKLKVGAGYGNDEQLRGQVGWETAQLGDRTLTVGARLYGSGLENEMGGYLKRPFFWGESSAFNVDLRVGKRRERAFDYQYLDARAGLDKGFGAGFRAGFYGRAERVLQVSQDQALDAALRAGNSQVDTLASVLLGVTYTRTDNPVAPSRGLMASLTAEPTRALDARVNFTRTLLDGRWYVPAGEDKVVALKLRTGRIFSGKDPSEIPLSRRFYAGGANSVRGYRYNGLGPLSANGALLGGSALFEASTEFRFPVKKDVSGVVFLDAGNAFPSTVDLRRLSLYSGTGFGARLKTPVGPVGVDLAFKLKRDPLDRSPYYFYLFIGYSF